MVSLWPGAVKTEYIQDKILNVETKNPMMAAVENVIKKTGRILQTRDLANEYSFQEDDGTLPPDMRQVNNLLAYAGFGWLSYIVPSFIRIPMWVMHFGSYKF